jgi:Zn-dependent M28 family amino/carboxypeptidase
MGARRLESIAEMTEKRATRLYPWLALVSLLVGAAGCNSAPAPGAKVPQYASSSGRTPTTMRATGAPRDAHALASVDPHVVLNAKKSITYLASEELEGRGLGTHGVELAADFVARRFAEIGLRPLPGKRDFYQPFAYTSSAKLGKDTRLKINKQSFEPRKEFTPVSFSAEGAFSAPVVFVGYGIGAPEKHNGYDDYAGIDVKGKVVLVLRYDPHDENGDSRLTGRKGDWSEEASLSTKAKAAADRGAVALLLVNPPNFHGSRDRLMPFQREFDGGASPIPVLHVRQPVANALLKQANAPGLKVLQERIDTSGKPASMPLSSSTTASGNVAIERDQSQVKNVMAMLPGAKTDEFVVVGAHYDHLGRGGRGSLRPNAKAVHFGADDNASGTAALIELARQMVRAGRPERSVIFVAFTAEEEGLHGSRHFVNHPPVPLESIVAMLNLDMVGRVRNHMMFVGGAGTAEAFDAILKSADDASPLRLKTIGRGGFGPSDHMSFALKKIPVIFLFSGMHPEYHTPNDTPEKINYVGVAQSVALSQELVRSLAAMPRQTYDASSDSQPLLITSAHSGGGGPERGDRDPTERRASLGVIPDYGTDTSKDGVRISGATAGTAAAEAGLREGDVITQINDDKIESLMDLTNFLNKSKPGDKARITVMRDGKPLELEATLKARGG